MKCLLYYFSAFLSVTNFDIHFLYASLNFINDMFALCLAKSLETQESSYEGFTSLGSLTSAELSKALLQILFSFFVITSHKNH